MKIKSFCKEHRLERSSNVFKKIVFSFDVEMLNSL